jgi:hypothetical protein
VAGNLAVPARAVVAIVCFVDKRLHVAVFNLSLCTRACAVDIVAGAEIGALSVDAHGTLDTLVNIRCTFVNIFTGCAVALVTLLAATEVTSDGIDALGERVSAHVARQQTFVDVTHAQWTAVSRETLARLRGNAGPSILARVIAHRDALVVTGHLISTDAVTLVGPVCVAADTVDRAGTFCTSRFSDVRGLALVSIDTFAEHTLLVARLTGTEKLRLSIGASGVVAATVRAFSALINIHALSFVVQLIEDVANAHGSYRVAVSVLTARLEVAGSADLAADGEVDIHFGEVPHTAAGLSLYP